MKDRYKLSMILSGINLALAAASFALSARRWRRWREEAGDFADESPPGGAAKVKSWTDMTPEEFAEGVAAHARWDLEE